MKHMTREHAVMRRLLHRARTVAIVGASPRPERHSHTVASYLSRQGYDVIPVHPDGQDIAGLPTYSRLGDIACPVDVVVIFRRPGAVPAHIEEAASKGVDAVWLPPGTWSREAESVAHEHGLTLIKDRCIAEVHRHLSASSGHPVKWSVHVRRRKPTTKTTAGGPTIRGTWREAGAGAWREAA